MAANRVHDEKNGGKEGRILSPQKERDALGKKIGEQRENTFKMKEWNVRSRKRKRDTDIINRLKYESAGRAEIKAGSKPNNSNGLRDLVFSFPFSPFVARAELARRAEALTMNRVT